MNPFPSPSALVLSPWEYPGDEEYYVDIDNSEKSFKAFCDRMANINLTTSGYVFLTSGLPGCGKTALINRAAWYAMEFLSVGASRSVIINLADEAQPGMPTDRKIRSQCAVLAETLVNEDIIEQPEFEVLSQRVDDVLLFGKAVDSVLKKKDLNLIILLPRVELTNELKALVCAWRRKRVLSFIETDDLEVIEYCQRAHGIASGRPVERLEVGPLRQEDGWTFVHAKIRELSAHRPPVPSLPVIREDVLNEFMRERIGEGSVTSIRELYVTCFAVFERAINGSRTEITISDFALHYMRLGKI